MPKILHPLPDSQSQAGPADRFAADGVALELPPNYSAVEKLEFVALVARC